MVQGQEKGVVDRLPQEQTLTDSVLDTVVILVWRTRPSIGIHPPIHSGKPETKEKGNVEGRQTADLIVAWLNVMLRKGHGSETQRVL